MWRKKENSAFFCFVENGKSIRYTETYFQAQRIRENSFQCFYFILSVQHDFKALVLLGGNYRTISQSEKMFVLINKKRGVCRCSMAPVHIYLRFFGRCWQRRKILIDLSLNNLKSKLRLWSVLKRLQCKITLPSLSTYIHDWSLQSFSQDYGPSFSPNLCCVC